MKMSEIVQDVNQNMLSLLDEEGNEVLFEVLDMIEYKEENYVILLPEGEEVDVVILKVTAIDDTQDQFSPVESEEDVMAIFELFKERCKDDFDFE
jgi:uncharacterized protein YrzB (UPF0473 family)